MPTTTWDGTAGIGPLHQQRAKVPRRHPHEDAEAVLRLATADLEDGNQRPSGGQVGLGPLHVEVRDQALSVTKLDEPERLLLQLDVPPRQRDALGERTHLDVVGRHLRLKHDQHVVVGVDLGVERRVGRLDAAPEGTPKVQLPGRVESDRPVVVLHLDREGAERIGVPAELVA